MRCLPARLRAAARARSPFTARASSWNPTASIPQALSQWGLLQSKKSPSASAEYKRRTDDFFAGTLKPYVEQGETNAQAIHRLSGYAVTTIKGVADVVPLGAVARTALKTVNAADFIRKYGLHGLSTLYLGQDIIQAAQLLYACAQKIDVTEHAKRKKARKAEKTKSVSEDSDEFQLGMRDMIFGLYYKVAENAGERGRSPLAQEEEFGGKSWLRNDKNRSTLRKLLEYAPMALFFAYKDDPVDVQRLLQQKGYVLVVAETRPQEEEVQRPVFLLAAHPRRKELLLIVRGSHTALDWLANADFRTGPLFALPPQVLSDQLVAAPHSSELEAEAGAEAIADYCQQKCLREYQRQLPGSAHLGMLSRAYWLHHNLAPALERFERQGYGLVVTGHSQGGGVGALFTLLQNEERKRRREYHAHGRGRGHGKSKEVTNAKCYTYGVPACMDESLCALAEGDVYSLILQDDIVPRASLHNVRSMLLEIGSCSRWQEHLQEDWNAVTTRMTHLWAPKLRQVQRERREQRRQEQEEKERWIAEQEQEHAQQRRRRHHEDEPTSTSSSGAWAPKLPLPSMPSMPSMPSVSMPVALGTVSDTVSKDAFAAVSSAGTLARRAAGQAGQAVANRLPHASASASTAAMSNAISGAVSGAVGAVRGRVLGTDRQAGARAEAQAKSQAQGRGVVCSEDEKDIIIAEGAPGGLDFEPLLLPPGQLLLLYRTCGVHRAAAVPVHADTIRSLQPRVDMIPDHTSMGYFEALREALAIGNAHQLSDPPEWESFGTRDECACCSAHFSWASSAQSTAQAYLDTQNCHSCGRVICPSCLEHEKPLPHLGIHRQVRVCDECFYAA